MKFENSEYQDTIEKINKISSLGLSKLLPIPQIAIVGDQSTGKSSVLEAITKLSFPRNLETCTRFATQVTMRIGSNVELSARIEGETEFNELHRSEQSNLDISTIVQDANAILCVESQISEKVLEITITGPDVSPLTVVDLPGYINTVVDGQDRRIIEQIHAINTRYIQDSRTIILAVVPANVDLNNIYVLAHAEKYDTDNSRTIPIVTKPDTVVDRDLHRNLILTLQNKRKSMRYGYLVMRNSSNSDLSMSWEDAKKREEDFFAKPEWSEVKSNRKGRTSVKKFLGEVLFHHIRDQLPSLRMDVQRLITECDDDILSLGPQLVSLSEAKAQYNASILKLQPELMNFLRGIYTLDYTEKCKQRPSYSRQESVSMKSENSPPATDTKSQTQNNTRYEFRSLPSLSSSNKDFMRFKLHGLYDEYNRSMSSDDHITSKSSIGHLVNQYRGTELSGFITFDTFSAIYKETLSTWRKVTRDHIESMHMTLSDTIIRFIQSSADSKLRDLLVLKFRDFYMEQTKKIRENIENIFDDESVPFTMNEQYIEGYMNRQNSDQTLPVQQQQQQQQRFPNFDSGKGKGNQSSTILEISSPIYIDPEVERIYEKLVAYCRVARKRIVDVVILQTIERYMIKQINLYFTMLYTVDDNAIGSRLLDSQTKNRQRAECYQRKEILQNSLNEL
ncbi:hypothetical protein BGZ76_003169 [Entomortierella beljakovae]|nr:hypothetical protein BGZ76_003169 [Entomortierella beljakovae]